MALIERSIFVIETSYRNNNSKIIFRSVLHTITIFGIMYTYAWPCVCTLMLVLEVKVRVFHILIY